MRFIGYCPPSSSGCRLSMTTDGNVRAIRHPINRDSQAVKEQIDRLAWRSRRCADVRAVCNDAGHASRLLSATRAAEMRICLQRKLKRALVQSRVANQLPSHTCAQDGFEHVLLESANDRVLLEQIHNGGMTFENS